RKSPRPIRQSDRGTPGKKRRGDIGQNLLPDDRPAPGGREGGDRDKSKGAEEARRRENGNHQRTQGRLVLRFYSFGAHRRLGGLRRPYRLTWKGRDRGACGLSDLGLFHERVPGKQAR